jgi:acetyl-CoA synthetase
MRIKTKEEYQLAYAESTQSPEIFWSKVAENFSWKRKWDKVISGDFNKVDYKWFEGAQLNITENCLDRHLKTIGDKTAIIWEPNNPNDKNRIITYKELYSEVCCFANGLLKLGVKKSDTVCLYMPMIPELAIAVLACARIGAIHSVVFGGFSAQSIAGRIQDADTQWVITADGCYRGDKKLHLKNIMDEALLQCADVKKVVVYNRSNFECTMIEGRDIWWNDLISDCDDNNIAAIMNAEDPLFILYTSGSTGKPKGVLHTCAGYMVYAAYTFQNVFQYNDEDVYWCTADIGWVTGHSYIIYGPLLSGATTVLFEGIPSFPDWGRFWDVIDKYQVNIFYTAPTAIRSLEAQGNEHVEKRSLKSLKVLGSVGEPINEEAWHWYDKNIGKKNCPIVDTWWQTETGGILISSLAGVTPSIPVYATLPLPGVLPIIVDSNGIEITAPEAEGNLCIKHSWPGQARSVYKDHERFIQTYFSTYKNLYFTGDGCKRDANGNYRITGRVDDVINVSGHRIGTAEVENAINEHELVYESAVVGFPHDIKGQGLMAFVSCINKPLDNTLLISEINSIVSKVIGSFAKPDKIYVVSGLPKTRSGKIMRRILRKIAEGESEKVGDISTLLNPEVVEEIIKMVK